jgi:CRP-like cAMP-binding protein
MPTTHPPTTVFKFPIFVVISAHWLSCIFFWIAASSEDPSNAWTSINLVNNAALGDQYIASLYWSISSMTTVGYGDIVAISSEERLFSIATMLLASTFFAFFVGNMAHIISNVDATSAMYKSKMEFVSEFLAYQQLPEDLQSRIKSFYAHCWKRLSSFPYSEHHILGELSASLRREVVLYLNREMVEKVPFFHGQSDSFIANLILSMKIEICAPHDTIMQEGDIGHCMYFLRRGIVEVISGDGRTIFTTLSDGAFFGEVSLLVSGRRTASIRAVTHCDLLRLEQEDLNKALLDYPEAMHRITQLASDNKYQLSAKDQRVLRARFETIEKQMEADVNGRTDDDDDCEAEDYAGEDNDGDNDGDDNDNNDGGGGGGGGDRLRKSTTRRKSALEEGNTDMFFSIVDALRAKRSTASSLKSASMKSASMKSSSLMSRSSCPDQPPPA